MNLRRATNFFYDAAIALVYPQGCAVCGGGVESCVNGVACESCWRVTRIFSGDETVCWKCGAEARGSVPEGRRIGVMCRRCDHQSFTAARGCGIYEKALRASVLALKRDPQVGPRLARLVCEAQKRAPINRATRIVPVPLHELRRRERGFDQAAELGHVLARQTGLPIDEWSLVRTTHTERHRAGMDLRARVESVDGAFEVKRPRLVEGECILLVDDVFTTGATVSACSRVLIAAGAQEVYVLTVARPAGHWKRE